MSVKEAFIKRVAIKDEYLVATVLDPAQVHSDYVHTYLEKSNVTALELIKRMVKKYEIQVDENQIQHSLNNPDDSHMVKIQNLIINF